MLRISRFYVPIKNCGIAVRTPATALYQPSSSWPSFSSVSRSHDSFERLVLLLAFALEVADLKKALQVLMILIFGVIHRLL
jgi:hypothetical protein